MDPSKPGRCVLVTRNTSARLTTIRSMISGQQQNGPPNTLGLHENRVSGRILVAFIIVPSRSLRNQVLPSPESSPSDNSEPLYLAHFSRSAPIRLPHELDCRLKTRGSLALQHQNIPFLVIEIAVFPVGDCPRNSAMGSRANRSRESIPPGFSISTPFSTKRCIGSQLRVTNSPIACNAASAFDRLNSFGTKSLPSAVLARIFATLTMRSL